MTAFALRYLSLGAGRQSTAVYLLAVAARLLAARRHDWRAWLAHPPVRAFARAVVAHDRGRGEIAAWLRAQAAVPSVAIFADTQDEPAAVYAHLDRLAADFGAILPIHRVTAGRLSHGVLSSKQGRRFAAPPLHVRNRDGQHALLRRQCTREFKIAPIQREVRRMLGVAKGRRVPKATIVESWQGISRDEASRMRTAREPWARNRYPLALELGWTADDCARFNAAVGYPAAKSACVFCPFTDDVRWREMRDRHPDEWAQAVAFDRALREGPHVRGVESESYVHRSLVPLDEVDLSTAADGGHLNLFENECEGMCGV